MGRKSRIKKIRKQLAPVIEGMGLKDELSYVVSANKQYKAPVLDADGNPTVDENGIKFEIKTYQTYTAHNPLRRMVKQLSKESKDTVRAFIQEYGNGSATESK